MSSAITARSRNRACTSILLVAQPDPGMPGRVLDMLAGRECMPHEFAFRHDRGALRFTIVVAGDEKRQAVLVGKLGQIPGMGTVRVSTASSDVRSGG